MSDNRKLVCPHCDGRMSLHDANELLGHVRYGQIVTPWICEHCNNEYMIALKLSVAVEK